MNKRLVATMAMAAIAATPGQAAPAKRDTPYYASIAPARARMRTGPGRSYPASWLYVRPDLPVKVLALYKEWRKVEDPGGTQGWILGALLSDRRTAIVENGVADLRDRPDDAGRVLWRAEPGVVGRLSHCADGWCRLDVHGQAGFVETGHLWGVDGDESVP